MNLTRKLVFTALIIYCLFYLINSAIIIGYPYQISYPEGFLLNQAKRISDAKPIYHTINEYPYIIANYPPLYPYLCAIFVKLFGVSFAPGRIITFVSVLLISLLIYRILRNFIERENALIAGLLFIASSYIYKNSPFMRVDLTGLLLCLAGIYSFIKNKNLIIPVIFFVGALYTKQTFVAAPLAVAIFLFINERKKAFIFIAELLILYALLFLLVNNLTDGEFYRHNFLYNMNIFQFKQAIKHYVWALQNHAIIFLFSVIYVLYSIAEKKYPLLLIYFLLACIIAFSVGKIGANMNYFFEMIALSCILTGLCLERLRGEIERKIFNFLINGALIVQLLLFLHMPYLTEPTPTKPERKEYRKLSEIIAKTEGNIISEDAGLLVLNNRSVLFQPFEFTQLANQRLWSQTVFIHNIRHKLFSLIILSFNLNCWVDEERLTPEMVQVIKENYYIKEKIGEYYLYYPKIEN